MSTTKVEYMAASEVAKEAMWLDGLVRELGRSEERRVGKECVP